MKSIIMVFSVMVFSFQLGAAVTHLQARFSKGKTFITFSEEAGVGLHYRLYRSSTSITTLSGLTPRVTLHDSTSWDPRYHRHHIIEDEGAELPDSVGLFVYTPRETADVYYAVTTVNGNTEDTTLVADQNVLTTPLHEEFWRWPHGVIRTRDATWGHSYRLFYWMDYFDWNHHRDYYGDVFTVEVNYNLLGKKNVPLTASLHGGGATVWQTPVPDGSSSEVMLAINDHSLLPGQTWWYGYSKEFGTADSFSTRDTIIDYTAQRLIFAIQSIKADPRFNIDTNRVYITGSSMGGSGSLLLAFQHPDIFAAARTNLALVRYDDYYKYWNLDPLSKFDHLYGIKTKMMTARNGVNIYNWTDACWIALRDLAINLPPVVNTHGEHDDLMPMRMHRRLYQTMATTRQVIFGQWKNTGHSYAIAGDTVISGSYRRFRKDELSPAFSNASQDDNYGQRDPDTSSRPRPNDFDSLVHDSAGVMNMYIDWSSSLHRLGLPGDSLIDCPDSIALTLKSNRANTTVDITPRRVQKFNRMPGGNYTWENVDVATGAIVNSGHVIADSNGLITVEQFAVSNTGNRLIIHCEGECQTSVKQASGLAQGMGISVFPNPFNSRVNIRMQRQENTPIKIEVYDINGKLIKRLLHNPANRGLGLTWNADGVNSGIYLIRITVGGRTASQRISLIK
ncbi:MAG: T9SS type A sorting domain-containing protein [Fibrobacterota bacterium]